ncbi:Crp/Fnr family transcriptional regulator [Owenweeksia hongkongensis]|uniref:Crp/Fnr family transcriptional regulator n=1 Tax=Owenweeksia hongkongensis TaxID=253245 RepID=UPI003A9006D2
MSESHQFWMFNDVNLFQVMCPSKLTHHPAAQDGHKVYSKGETIYFTDDPANTLYLIASGKVRILNYSEDGDEVVRAILGKGEMFGELALLGEDRRTEIAEAMDDETMVCSVHTDYLQELMQDDAEFTFKIYKWIGLRMKKMERRIDNLIFKDVRSRLMDFIKEMAQEKGKQTDNGIEVEHFFTHKNLANLIGTSRQTVTTTLNELRDEGLIDFSRRQVIIKKPHAF